MCFNQSERRFLLGQSGTFPRACHKLRVFTSSYKKCATKQLDLRPLWFWFCDSDVIKSLVICISLLKRTIKKLSRNKSLLFVRPKLIYTTRINHSLFTWWSGRIQCLCPSPYCCLHCTSPVSIFPGGTLWKYFI